MMPLQRRIPVPAAASMRGLRASSMMVFASTRALLDDFTLPPDADTVVGTIPGSGKQVKDPSRTIQMEGVRANIKQDQWANLQIKRTRRARSEGRQIGTAVMSLETEYRRKQAFKNRKAVISNDDDAEKKEMNKLLGPFAKFIKRRSDVNDSASTRISRSVLTYDGNVEQDDPNPPIRRPRQKVSNPVDVAPRAPRRLFGEKEDERVWRAEEKGKHHKHAYTVHNELSDDIDASLKEQRVARSLRLDADGTHTTFYNKALGGRYDFEAEREKAKDILEGAKGVGGPSSPLSTSWGHEDPISASVGGGGRGRAQTIQDFAVSSAEESTDATSSMLPSFAENEDGETFVDSDIDGRGASVFHSAAARVAAAAARGGGNGLVATNITTSPTVLTPAQQSLEEFKRDIAFHVVDPNVHTNPLTLAETYVRELEAARALRLRQSTSASISAPNGDDLEGVVGEADRSVLSYHPDDTFIPVRNRHTPMASTDSHDSLSEHDPHVPRSDLVTPEEVSRVASESASAYVTTLTAEMVARDTRLADGDALVQDERSLGRSQNESRILPQTAVFASELDTFERSHFEDKRKQRIFPSLPPATKAAPKYDDDDLRAINESHARQLDIGAFLGPRSERSIFDGVLCGKDNFEEEIVGKNADGTDKIIRRKALKPGASRVGAYKYPNGLLDEYFIHSPIPSKEGDVEAVPIGAVDDDGMITDHTTNYALRKQLESQWTPASENPHFPTDGEVGARSSSSSSYPTAEQQKAKKEGMSASQAAEYEFLTSDDYALPGGYFPKQVETMPRFRTTKDKHRYMLLNLVAPTHSTARHALKMEREIIKDGYLKSHVELASGVKPAHRIEGSKGHVLTSSSPNKGLVEEGNYHVSDAAKLSDQLSTAEGIDADELLPQGENMHGKVATSFSPLSEEQRDTVVSRRDLEEWHGPDGMALRDDIEQYRDSNLERIDETRILGDAVVDTAKAGMTTRIVGILERKYDVMFPRNLNIPNEWVTLSRIVPTDGTAITVIPRDEQVTMRTGDARRMARSLGLDLIKFTELKSTHTNPVAVCKLADHRYDKRDFVAFSVKKRAITSPVVRECKEMSFRGTTHPHAVWFKSVTVGKLLSHGFPVQLRMTNFGGPREGTAAFQSILMEVKRQAGKLSAFHTSGEVIVEYDLISCTLYPTTVKSPKAAIIHPTTAELKTARDHRILEQDKEMYHEDLQAAFASGDNKDGIRYVRKLQLGTAWSDKDEGLSLKRSRDMKKIYGWIPKSNTKLYEARGDVELNAPFNASTPTTIEKINYPRESNLDQALRGITVLQERYVMGISEMHDKGQTEDNEATISRGYYRVQGNALDIGAFKESLGLKTNRRKLPQRTSGWSTLGVADDKPE